MIDPIATADAIRLLEEKRIEAAPLPESVWRIMLGAKRHLDDQLREYFALPTIERPVIVRDRVA
jgi:hypothetical protein